MATETSNPKKVERSLEQRVLIAAPLGRDAEVLSEVLQETGIETAVCPGLEELCREIETGAAVAIVAEEVLVPHSRHKLTETLSRQPEWSDFPLVVMTSVRKVLDQGWEQLSAIHGSAHVVVLERPVRTITLRSLIHAAIQARFRQYQVRDELFQRRQTEEELRRAHNLLWSIIESTPDIVFAKDREGRHLLANSATFRAVGRSEKQVVAQTEDHWFDDPELVSTIQTNDRRVMETGQTETVEEAGNMAEGHRVFRITKTPLRNQTGEIVGLVGVGRDVTAEKHTEQILRESEARFKTFFEHLPLPLWEEDWSEVRKLLAEFAASGITDMRTYLQANPQAVGMCLARVKLLDTNQAGLDLLNASDKRTVLQHLDRLITPESWNVVADLLAAIAEGQPRFQGEEFITACTGEQRQVLFDFVVLPGYLESLERVLVSMVDITKRKEAEMALQTANAQLEQRVADRTAELERQNRRLRQLANQLTEAEQHERGKLARMLHDGLQQVLVASQVQLKLCRQQTSSEAFDCLKQLLGEAIDASRSLSYELSPPTLQMSELPEALLWLARWFHTNHRFQVQLQVGEAFPIVADPMKTFLFHAIRELLLNSVKHSGSQAATVLLRDQPSRHVHLTVADDGKGFDPRELESENEQQQGIGLFSIRERLAALGGTFQIDSRPGAGARFDLIVPLKEKPIASPTEGVQSSEVPVPRPGLHEAVRVLVVDDHGIFRQGLTALLKSQEGIELVGEACDGVEAIERTEELHPDIVLMDINMPRMNGIEATRHIKRNHPEISIIGLSFHEEQDKAESMRRAGASTYFRKGSDPETLLETIREWPPPS